MFAPEMPDIQLQLTCLESSFNFVKFGYNLRFILQLCRHSRDCIHIVCVVFKKSVFDWVLSKLNVYQRNYIFRFPLVHLYLSLEKYTLRLREVPKM